ncbi:hypothetical protein [Burkholderia sp. B21-005]|uniref:hypothetical protein n=1 Tax=Burkholderia sp. B21-005 TaxID=2890406 RepID=UPI001E2CAC3B|nr:hypothetical protein [Burkholderia sp. B21-005]UEP43841.1 hypothetical protein LMA02_27720 [Burkholderia sp. B21-005]
MLLRRRDGVPFQTGEHDLLIPGSSFFVQIPVFVLNPRGEVEIPAAHERLRDEHAAVVVEIRKLAPEPVVHVRIRDADARRQQIHMAACRRSAQLRSTAA